MRAHRDAVPPEFAESVPLAAHQKAADYTRARTRLGIVDALVSAAVLLALTLGGGLQWLYDAWARAVRAGRLRARDRADPVASWRSPGCSTCRSSIYRTFVIEARFGFNRMTPALFVADLAQAASRSALALGVPLLLAVLWLMAQMGELWWLYVWLAWIGLQPADAASSTRRSSRRCSTSSRRSRTRR